MNDPSWSPQVSFITFIVQAELEKARMKMILKTGLWCTE